MTRVPGARAVAPIGELRPSLSRCRNCGRRLTAPLGQGIHTFCCVVCFERYPVDACASMATRDLVRLVAAGNSKAVTDAIRTRQELEAAAGRILVECDDEMINVNPDGFIPFWVVTRRGADRARSYNVERVEPVGPAPPMALAAERAYILAKGGGAAEHMAAAIVQELPPEAMGALAEMLGSGKWARDRMAQLGGPRAAEAHDRVFAGQLGAQTVADDVPPMKSAHTTRRCVARVRRRGIIKSGGKS